MFSYNLPQCVAYNEAGQLMLTLPPVYLDRVYYSRDLKALWNKAPNMDSLIAVGSGASFLYSLYGAVCIFMGIDPHVHMGECLIV